MFAVITGAPVSPYSETLGGSTNGAVGSGFVYARGSFADLASGGPRNLGLLTFDRTGLSAGLYTQAIEYALFSRYTGFADASLIGQRIFLRANLLAPVVPPVASAVPEPASWTLIIGGVGLVGGAMRRRKSNVRTTILVDVR